MQALLLDDASPEFLRTCQALGLTVIRAKDVAEGRALLARRDYLLVDGRISRSRPLGEEIHHRLDLFFEKLRGHSASRLYQTVMREVERPLIAMALRRAGGVRASAARELGIDRGTLARRIRALGLKG